jgi:cyclophilin family peptidyl-prolyl cis-trans isomerase
MIRTTSKTRTSLLILASLACMSAGKHARLPEDAGFQKRDAVIPLKNPAHQLWKRHSPDGYRVRLETTKGRFIIEVHRVWAPLGADRFYNLVTQGFFDDSRIFRVRAGYITQFGIAGDAGIASIWRNQAIPDDPVKQSNLRGIVAFAMTGPDTRTTQIYINLVDNTRLDNEGFAPFGKVVEGMEIVDQFYSGYGEEAGGGMRRGKQGPIFEEGNKYLDQNYPRLDRLIRATIVRSGE